MAKINEIEHRYILVGLSAKERGAIQGFCNSCKRQERPFIQVVKKGRRASVDADFITMSTELTEDGMGKIHRLMQEYQPNDWYVGGTESAYSAWMDIDQAISLAKQVYRVACRDQYMQTGNDAHLP